MELGVRERTKEEEKKTEEVPGRVLLFFFFPTPLRARKYGTPWRQPCGVTTPTSSGGASGGSREGCRANWARAVILGVGVIVIRKMKEIPSCGEQGMVLFWQLHHELPGGKG